MKFYAEPNLYVSIASKHLKRIAGVKGLSFDANGEYVTDNTHLINALKIQFKHEDEELHSVEETSTVEEQIESVEIVEEEISSAESEIETIVETEEKPKTTRRGRKQ